MVMRKNQLWIVESRSRKFSQGVTLSPPYGNTLKSLKRPEREMLYYFSFLSIADHVKKITTRKIRKTFMQDFIGSNGLSYNVTGQRLNLNKRGLHNPLLIN